MTLNLQSCLRDGDLPGALEAATAAVKSAPTDASARTALFEVLCFSGDLERAEKQLDVLASESLEMAYGASALKALLEGEQHRRKVAVGDAEPYLLGQETDWARPLISAAREGEAAAELEALRQPVAGELNGEAFDDLRDGDDLLAPLLEVMLAGRYVWLRWSEIASLTSEAPQRQRDLFALPVKLLLTSGQEYEAHVPVLYVNSHLHADDKVKLGLTTEWDEEQGLVRGKGRHLLYADGEGVDLLAVRELTFGG